MVKAFNDTKIPSMVTTGLYTEKAFDVSADMAEKLLDVMVYAVTDALNDIKSLDTPVAFRFAKQNGDFLAAAVVQFFPNEDKSKPGNWNYSWTFDEEDVPTNALIKTLYDSSLISYFRGASVTKYGFDVYKSEYFGDTMCYLIQMIKKWLDDNADESEEVGVALDGVIQFRVAVEKGGKVFSAEPDSEIKLMIKDDKAIEV